MLVPLRVRLASESQSALCLCCDSVAASRVKLGAHCAPQTHYRFRFLDLQNRQNFPARPNHGGPRGGVRPVRFSPCHIMLLHLLGAGVAPDYFLAHAKRRMRNGTRQAHGLSGGYHARECRAAPLGCVDHPG